MLKFLASIFMLYAAYASWTAYITLSFVPLVGTLLATHASIGLWLHRRWCRYSVYALGVGYTVIWLWLLLETGTWPRADVGALRNTLALVPGFGIVVLMTGICFIVSKRLPRQNR